MHLLHFWVEVHAGKKENIAHSQVLEGAADAVLSSWGATVQGQFCHFDSAPALRDIVILCTQQAFEAWLCTRALSWVL